MCAAPPPALNFRTRAGASAPAPTFKCIHFSLLVHTFLSSAYGTFLSLGIEILVWLEGGNQNHISTGGNTRFPTIQVATLKNSNEVTKEPVRACTAPGFHHLRILRVSSTLNTRAHKIGTFLYSLGLIIKIGNLFPILAATAR